MPLYGPKWPLKRGNKDTYEVYDDIKQLWGEVEDNHSKFNEKGNKSAGARARKALGGIKKLISEYRKSSVAEDKRK